MSVRRRRIVRAWTLMVAVAAGVGTASGMIIKSGPSSHGAAVAAVAAVVALFAVGCAATLPYWRRIDDAARDAHRTAWYWGGGCGAGAGLLTAMVLDGALGPMARGAMLTFGLAFAGYALAWAGWWLARRPAGSA